MMDNTDLVNILHQFCKEYDVDISKVSIEFDNEIMTDEHTLGTTYHHTDYVNHCYFSVIFINNHLSKLPLSCRSTVWHEFCHAEKWVKEHVMDGHGIEFQKRVYRKPLLGFYSEVVSRIIWVFVRLRY